jgi:hypothetical protein
VASPVLPPKPWTAAVKPTTAIQNQSDQVQNIQARVVQHHYVRAELRDINMRKGGGLVQATLNALKLTPQGRQCTNAQLLEGFQHMTKRLQSAELTINIKAASWFMNPNNFDSYSQMYERAVRTVNTPGGPSQQMRLKDDPLNPAQQRAAADSKVTFRKDMMAGGQFKPAFGGLGRVMSPGDLVTPLVDAKPGEFEASNPYFNPKSKQVFAALNYGRRPHGSTITYGRSYLVLNPKFKTNAIYFAGDTFGVSSPGFQVAADDQISYDLLGAIYSKAKQAMQADLYKSCILDGSLKDAPASFEISLLLEAHLFEPLTFAGNLATIVLSGGDKLNGQPLTGSEWQVIQGNARTFAAKHGAKLVYTD